MKSSGAMPVDCSKTEPRVFFRADCFYIIDLPPGTEADNAHCNPGTLRIEDMHGNVIWSPGKDQ